MFFKSLYVTYTCICCDSARYDFVEQNEIRQMVINQVHGLTLICDGRPSIGYSIIRNMFQLNFLMLSIFLGWGYNWKWKRHRNYNPICRGNYSSITGSFGHQCPKSGKHDSGGRTWFLSDYGAHSFRPGTRYYHWTGQTSQISNLCLRICREWRFRVKTSLLCFFRDALSTNLDWKSCKITFNMYSQMSIPQKTSSVLTWNKLLYHTSFFFNCKISRFRVRAKLANWM